MLHDNVNNETRYSESLKLFIDNTDAMFRTVVNKTGLEKYQLNVTGVHLVSLSFTASTVT